MSQVRKPLLLMILDGWGYTQETQGNAVYAARTPVLDALLDRYPSCLLEASGEAVGLPDGQMGNSEVGHLNIGAGRIIYQDLTRINKSIKDKEFFSNPVLCQAMDRVKKKGSSLHIMGLFSHGGVHSHIEHMRALIGLAKDKGLDNIYIHAFLDGRDVPPRVALEDMQEHMSFYHSGFEKFATITGRYYAMDRDKRWERTRLAYDAMTKGVGLTAHDPCEAIEKAYVRGEDDEFVKPTVIVDEEGMPVGTIKDGDALVFFNFRPDRARQLTYAFVNKDFNGFERRLHPDVSFVCMTEYDETLDVPIAYPPESFENTLGEVLSRAGLKQLRIAETEKYAHVTFFFNGGVEKQNKGEERCLIPSPKVATYELRPEMSAYEVTEEIVRKIRSGVYDVFILNFANMDMVGHTGIFDVAVRAVEYVDECVGRVIDSIKAADGVAFITADHGNAEKMIDYITGKPHTAHTSNPVRCILVSQDDGLGLRPGILADIAPSMLEILGINKPKEMTGRSLLVRN